MSESGLSDLDDIRSMNQRRGPTCRTGIMLAAMEATLAQTVRDALADDTITGKALSHWLGKRHGIEIGYYSLARHGNGDCACE